MGAFNLPSLKWEKSSPIKGDGTSGSGVPSDSAEMVGFPNFKQLCRG